MEDRAILKTLAYFGTALRWPLTAVEVAQRVGPAWSLGRVVEWLDDAVAEGRIKTRLGFYALPDVDDEYFYERVERQKECAQKWKRMLPRAQILTCVPYIRALFASGSLALGNTSASSDWDMFVVAQSGRLYTARAGVLLVAWLLGRLRTKHHRTAPDLFCFNHWVTITGLRSEHTSLFTAHGFAMLIPVHDPKKYLERLWQANRWIEDYTARPTVMDWQHRSVTPGWFLLVLQKFLEFILNTPVGTLMERVLCGWMQQRITANPATHAKGGRVVATDREIEFHPRSFEAVALARYNAAMSRLVSGFQVERDSGLR